MNEHVKYLTEKKENPLISANDLFNAALNEFSQKSFNEASLNSILKKVKMNKGSFYYRFYDKTDLYLSMVNKIGLDKIEYFKTKNTEFPTDFFEQIETISLLGLEYAKKEKRYYSFWRTYLSESDEIKKIIIDAFPEFGQDLLQQLVDHAIEASQLPDNIDSNFLYKVTSIYINNIDKLIDPEMSDDEIKHSIKQFTQFYKYGLLNG